MKPGFYFIEDNLWFRNKNGTWERFGFYTEGWFESIVTDDSVKKREPEYIEGL